MNVAVSISLETMVPIVETDDKLRARIPRSMWNGNR